MLVGGRTNGEVVISVVSPHPCTHTDDFRGDCPSLRILILHRNCGPVKTLSNVGAATRLNRVCGSLGISTGHSKRRSRQTVGLTGTEPPSGPQLEAPREGVSSSAASIYMLHTEQKPANMAGMWIVRRVGPIQGRHILFYLLPLALWESNRTANLTGFGVVFDRFAPNVSTNFYSVCSIGRDAPSLGFMVVRLFRASRWSSRHPATGRSTMPPNN